MRRLRFELIALLVLAAVLPLVAAGFAANELFGRSFDPLLGATLPAASDAALVVTRDAIEGEKSRWLDAIRAGAPLDTLDARAVATLGLAAQPPREPLPAAVRGRGPRVLRAPQLVWADSSARLVAEVAGTPGVSTWIARPLPDSLARRALAVERGARLLSTLRREREALRGGFLATFLVVYGGLVLLVLALGLLLLSRLTRPLSDLSAGIGRVAAGDLAARVPERGGAELAELLRRFNGMTERLQTQQEDLSRLERLAAWRQMARFLAHEIKNPLTPIQLAAEQVRDAYRGDDPAYTQLVHEATAIIQEEIAGLRTWVNEFSQFARLPEVQAASVAPAEIVAELRALYGEGALDAHVASAAGPLWCDADQLKRALVNLVDNGRAAQREAGIEAPIGLEFAPAAAGGTRIRVRDHGPGIAPERRQRVFEPDYTTKPDGMGLGLAIVESIVRQHGGAIAIVETRGPGATFEIVLPPRGDAGGSAA